jgi:hypothetical protein
MTSKKICSMKDSALLNKPSQIAYIQHTQKAGKKMKFITVNGLSRSGNHAIIRWIVGQYKDFGYESFFHNNAIRNFMEYLQLRGGGAVEGFPTANPKFHEIIMHLTAADKKMFAISFEDLIFDQRFGEITKFTDHNVVILRDPFNLFASRIEGLPPPRGKRGHEKTADKQDDEIKKYISQYEEFVGKTNYLSNKICISYNNWVADKEYRRSIAEQFGVKFTDARYAQRACSSFGGKGGSMSLPSEKPEDFLNRYKACLDEPMFRKIKENEELASIALDVFGIKI